MKCQCTKKKKDQRSQSVESIHKYTTAATEQKKNMRAESSYGLDK